jgi:hypothetical protein
MIALIDSLPRLTPLAWFVLSFVTGRVWRAL